MTNFRRWFHRFAVRSIVWRHYLDFGVRNVPFYLRPMMIFFWSIFFYFFAAPARRAILSNLRVVLTGVKLPAQSRPSLANSLQLRLDNCRCGGLQTGPTGIRLHGGRRGSSSNWLRRAARFCSLLTWAATISARRFLRNGINAKSAWCARRNPMGRPRNISTGRWNGPEQARSRLPITPRAWRSLSTC